MNTHYNSRAVRNEVLMAIRNNQQANQLTRSNRVFIVLSLAVILATGVTCLISQI